MKRDTALETPTAAVPALLGNQPIGFTETPRQWAQINPDGKVFVDWDLVEEMAKKMSVTPMAKWSLPEAHAYILWQVRQEAAKVASGVVTLVPKAEGEVG